MSISIVDKRTIHDKNGKKILNIPINSLLNNIIIDLWGDIVRYMDYYPFIIGIDKPHYRKITLDEFENMKIKFMEYYWKNNGVHMFGDVGIYDNYLNIGDMMILLNKYLLAFRVRNQKIVIQNGNLSDVAIKNNLECKRLGNMEKGNTILIPDI